MINRFDKCIMTGILIPDEHGKYCLYKDYYSLLKDYHYIKKELSIAQDKLHEYRHIVKVLHGDNKVLIAP